MTVQKRCNFVLFDSATCGLNKADWQKTGVITSATGADMVINGGGIGAAATGWYVNGVLQMGAGDNVQLRRITYDSSTNSDNRRIIVDRALTGAVGRDRGPFFPAAAAARPSAQTSSTTSRTSAGMHLCPRET